MVAGKYAGSKRTTKEKTAKTQEEFLKSEVLVIASFAVAVLLFLSNFKLCGFIGAYLRTLQLGLFGTMGFAVPILLFVGTSFTLSNQGNPIAVFKLLSVIGTAVVLCALLELLFSGGYEEGHKLADSFARGAAGSLGGGFIGGLLVMIFWSLIGTIGTYVALFVLLVICVVCITEKSLVTFIKKESNRAYQYAREEYQYAREDADRRRVVYQEQKEEKRRLREEKRVRGVNLESTKLTMEDAGISMPVTPADAVYVDPMELSIGPETASKESIRFEERKAAAGKTHNNADVFTGSIQMPSSYIEPDDAKQSKGKKASEDLKPEPEQIVRPQKKKAVELWKGTGESVTDTEQEDITFLDEDYIKNELERDFLAEEIPGTTIPEWETQIEPTKSILEPEKDLEWIPRKIVEKTETVWEEPADTEEVSEDCMTEDTVEESQQEPLYGKKDRKIIQEMEQGLDENAEFEEESVYRPGEFSIPEETKRVVTASGKVIESDTEALKKKIEQHREEAKESGELSVSQRIMEQPVMKKEYRFPPIELLKRGSRPTNAFSEQEYKETAIKLQQTLQNFGVGVTVTNISCGPSVTRYELHPEQGVKVSKIVGLADDIKLSLAAADIRIEAPIPGKSAVGIEVPNKENTVVYLRDILESDDFERHSSNLAFAVGKDIAGQVVVTDVAKMPHLLIAGATGSGKSVCINTLIMSLIYKSNPEDVKMIMVDPKVVELSVYNGIPHLLIPVVTDPKKASAALNWAVAEMMDRYKKFAKYNVRDLKGYNAKVEAIRDIEDDKKPQKMPQIVIIIDELADLMMVSPGEVEDSICRLAQLARAAGIHLVIATQRPSVNVITGLIKANVPSRIAFSVSSGVDSRTIIDMNGAEKLLGKGDMLFYPSGFQKPQRVQGAFVSDQEVAKVVEFLVEQDVAPEYNTEIEKQMTAPSMMAVSSDPKSDGRDEYFAQAGKFIIEKEKGSIGMLQRMFKIGFNRAARIMDQLADAGVVGDEEGTKPRKVLMTIEEFEAMLSDQQDS